MEQAKRPVRHYSFLRVSYLHARSDLAPPNARSERWIDRFGIARRWTPRSVATCAWNLAQESAQRPSPKRWEARTPILYHGYSYEYHAGSVRCPTQSTFQHRTLAHFVRGGRVYSLQYGAYERGQLSDTRLSRMNVL